MPQKRLKTKSKTKTHSQIKKEAWAVFSKWIRKRDNYTCYTCDTYYGPERMGLHAGHFVQRGHNSTFVDEMNVHAQCYACNVIKKGNAGEYAYRLIQQYGQEEFEKLVKRGRELKSWKPGELQEIITKYSTPK